MSRPPGRKSVIILDAPFVNDGHGNEVRDWSNAVRRRIRGCDVQPGSSMEYLLGRDSVLAAWFVFAPSGTVVDAYAHIVWQGVEYTVYGTPEVWAEDTRLDYVGIVLQKWEG
jgi:hypothetical protein